MSILALILLTACGPDPAIKHSLDAMVKIDNRMQAVINKVAPHNAMLAVRANQFRTRLRTQFKPAGHVRGPNGEFGAHAQGDCLDNPACFNFVFMPASESGTFLGGWHDDIRTLFLSDAINPDREESAFAMFHELMHNDQHIRGRPTDQKRTSDRWPNETEATDFEISLMDAASGGRFGAIVDRYLAEYRAGTRPGRHLNDVVVVEPDSDLFAIFQSKTPDEQGRVLLAANHLLNRRLIEQTTEGPERDERLATFCSHLQSAFQKLF